MAISAHLAVQHHDVVPRIPEVAASQWQRRLSSRLRMRHCSAPVGFNNHQLDRCTTGEPSMAALLPDFYSHGQGHIQLQDQAHPHLPEACHPQAKLGHDLSIL
ncbi:hypothetical protein VTI74DRAFT_6963 [Chaetomium olivicolor]